MQAQVKDWQVLRNIRNLNINYLQEKEFILMNI